MDLDAATTHMEKDQEGEDASSDSILDYIATLEIKTTLYEDVFTAVSVFRSLPPLAQNVVMRMLWLPNGVKSDIIKAWFKPQLQTQTQQKVGNLSNRHLPNPHPHTMHRLERLNLLSYDDDNDTYNVEPKFRASLRKYILNDSPITQASHDKNPPDNKTIASHARKSWEKLLRFLIDNDEEDEMDTDTKGSRDEGLEKVLLFSGLIEKFEERTRITPKGFSFLFLPHRKQVWTFLLGYVKYISKLQGNKRVAEQDTLRMLFKLSHLSLGEGYPTKQLSDAERRVLMTLRPFGFVYQEKDSSSRYYPTALATSLASMEDTLRDTLGQTHGRIVVETTFRIVAYTVSEIQIKLLSKFVRMDYRLPNVVIGMLTKESVTKALRSGITASGILTYLEQYAHPSMKRNSRKGIALPKPVHDRIRGWQADRERLVTHPAVFLKDFTSVNEYEEVLERARELGGLLLENENRRWLFVTTDCMKKLKFSSR